jgi:hypothetical protein
MDAPTSVDQSVDRDIMERNPATRSLIASAAGGLAALALVVFLRRLAGAVTVDLPPGEALVYTALFVATCLPVARRLASSIPDVSESKLTATASLVLALTFLAGLSTAPVTILAGSIVVGGVIGLSLIAGPAAERHLASSDVRDSEIGSSNVVAPIGRPHSPDEKHSIATAPSPVDSTSDAPACDDDAEPCVRLVRTGAGPLEQVTGSLRFETAPGETATTLHVPLWPALAGSPLVTCELEGIDGRANVPYAKSHGFRIEIRLPEPIDEPLEGVVHFVARCDRPAAAA